MVSVRAYEVKSNLRIYEGKEKRLFVTQNYLEIRFQECIRFFAERAIKWAPHV